MCRMQSKAVCTQRANLAMCPPFNQAFKCTCVGSRHDPTGNVGAVVSATGSRRGTPHARVQQGRGQLRRDGSGGFQRRLHLQGRPQHGDGPLP